MLTKKRKDALGTLGTMKDELKHLVDILPEEDMLSAIRFLQFLIFNREHSRQLTITSSLDTKNLKEEK